MKRILSALVMCAAAFAASSAEAGFRSSAYMNDTAALQMQLERHGYYTGPIDGQMGPITRGALQRFQHNNGLWATGRADHETRGLLFGHQIAYVAPAPVMTAAPIAYSVPVQTVEVAQPVVWPSPSSATLQASPISYVYNPSSYNVVTGSTASGGSIAYAYYTPISYKRVSGVNTYVYGR